MTLVPDYGDPREPAIRAKYAYLEATVSIVGNMGLFFLKMFIGVLIGSVSIMADAIHTLSDVGTSAVVIAGITAAKKEPDEGHPFGHGRYEYIATLMIALALLVVGVELFLASSNKFWHPSPPVFGTYGPLVYSGLLIGVVAKEAMARYGLLLGRKIDSRMLEADAWHHRADSITTIGVMAALVLVQLDIPPGYGHLADPALGVAISIYIAYEAVKLAKESMSLLAGRSGEEGKMDDIIAAASEVDGVEDVHDVYVHDYGTRSIVSLHVTVEGVINTKLSHRIATQVEVAVEGVFKGEAEAIVHIEPCGEMCSRDIERVLVKILKESPEIVSYHSMRSSVDEKGGHITVHALVDSDMRIETAHELVHSIDRRLKETHPGYRVGIHVEPCDKACQDCSMEKACEGKF